ncbi:hypothetical protein LTS14_010686 [Recurvomyces mirabilis]|nr:hypothetical protein LTS14_010686 [Recurvomyces mirabilis]
MRQHFDLFNARYSERAEREAKQVQDWNATQEKEKAGREGNAGTIRSAELVNGVDVNGI